MGASRSLPDFRPTVRSTSTSAPKKRLPSRPCERRRSHACARLARAVPGRCANLGDRRAYASANRDIPAEPTPASIAFVGATAQDPLRMYLVIRRGAFEDLSRAGELTGAAAVKCVREFAGDEALDEWRRRPGKVVLRARGGQWDEILGEPHALAGDEYG